MSVVVTAFPVPKQRAEVITAFDAAITRVHDEPGVEHSHCMRGLADWS